MNPASAAGGRQIRTLALPTQGVLAAEPLYCWHRRDIWAPFRWQVWSLGAWCSASRS